MHPSRSQVPTLTSMYKQDFRITKVQEKKLNPIKGDQYSCQEIFFDFKRTHRQGNKVSIQYKLESCDNYSINNYMFNFEGLSANYYGQQYCNYGYIYNPPCYYPDQSLPYNGSELNPFPPCYQQPSYPYSYLPACKPFDCEELKQANANTRDSDNGEQQEQKVNQDIHLQVLRQQNEVAGQQVRLEQKFGRNISSNIFHNIIKWVSSQKQFTTYLESAIQRNRMNMTPDDFQRRLKERTNGLKGYINEKMIKSFYRGKRIGATRFDLEFSKLMRILSKTYITSFHLPHIYSSSKIKKKSRKIHLQRMRLFLQRIK